MGLISLILGVYLKLRIISVLLVIKASTIIIKNTINSQSNVTLHGREKWHVLEDGEVWFFHSLVVLVFCVCESSLGLRDTRLFLSDYNYSHYLYALRTEMQIN